MASKDKIIPPGNPIPFNPETMTVTQLKQCAEILSTAFRGIERELDAEMIVGSLGYAREQMLTRWGRQS